MGYNAKSKYLPKPEPIFGSEPLIQKYPNEPKWFQFQPISSW